MTSTETTNRILDAARNCLLADGYAAMTTRKVAESAGVPLSQIHYHFGSKEEMILSLLRAENEGLLKRQAEMFGRDLPLWERWDLACDYLDQDLDSGYVRVLQEMTAAGWSSEVIGKEVRILLLGWTAVLLSLTRDAEASGIDLGVFTAEELVALVSMSFLGAESMILLGLESDRVPLRSALRRIGQMIRAIEEGST